MRRPTRATRNSTVSTSKKTENLFKIFGDIHNHIYANEGFSSQDAFAEVLKILFLKVEDERARGTPSRFYISASEKADISNGCDVPFYERMTMLFSDAKKAYADVFEADERLQLKTATLAFIVERLQRLSLAQCERDVKGIAFQKFVYASQRGERGQFFTPDIIVRLCVAFLSPKPTDRICDPACGSGGFLIDALRQQKGGSNKSGTIFGIEINPLVAKIAKMRMILEDVSHSAVIRANALTPLSVLSKESSGPHNDKGLAGMFDVIITNPPFGSQGKITNEHELRQFELGHRWNSTEDENFIRCDELQNGQTPEILFIERCLDLLKDGGRLAIVLPNGSFENSSLAYVRHFLTSKTKILAVVSLPTDTFQPYGTGVKASILFCQKLATKKLLIAKQKNYTIFFAKVTKVGYEGNKHGTPIYQKDRKGKIRYSVSGEPLIDEDVSAIIQDYRAFEQGAAVKGQHAFTVKYRALGSRLDAEYYDPHFRQLRSSLQKQGAKRLGDLVEIITKRSERLRNPEETIRYLELSDVSPLHGDIISCEEMQTHEAPSRASYEIAPGDIITAVAGNSVGTRKHATALVNEEFGGAICTNGFRVLKAKNINRFYLLAILRSDIFLNQMLRLRTGAAIPSVADEDLKNVLIPVPTSAQQKKIEAKIKESIALRARAHKILKEISQFSP